MRNRVVLLASVAMLTLASAAMAAGPTLSGVYIVSVSDLCQASVDAPTDKKTGDIQSFGFFDNGKIGSLILTANFNASKGTVSISGTDAEGSAIVGNGTGSAVTTSSVSASGPFKVTATSLTLPTGGDDEPATYDAVFVNPTSGITRQAYFMRVKSDNCIESGTAVHQ